MDRRFDTQVGRGETQSRQGATVRVTSRAAQRRALVGLFALGVSLGACSGAPTPEQTATTGATSAAPSASERPPAVAGQELTVGVREGQAGALPPWWTGSSVQAEVPAGVTPADKYRSEFFWSDPGGPQVKVGEGDRLRCRLQIGPHLGASGAERGVWQVVWQLHGPLRDGQWPAPPLNLHVRGGSWRIGGGAGRPDGYADYAKPFPAFVDDKNVVWDFDILVSQDPARARVDAWLDGEHVVEDWHPPSGTRYPDHAWLSMKSGLYTGSDPGTPPPTGRRYVTFSPMDCRIDRANPSTTAPTTPGSSSAPSQSSSPSSPQSSS